MDNAFLPKSLSDHPSLVGIVRMPFPTPLTEKMTIPVVMKDDNGNYLSGTQIVDMCTEILTRQVAGANFTVSKSKVTDFYPYTYYVLTDGETEPLILHPQYMPSSCTLMGVFALSHQPVERYYIANYKGDAYGNVYNITNISQMMLPTATNEGLNFMNSNANAVVQNRRNVLTNTVLGATTSLIGGAMSGNYMSAGLGVASSVIGGINSIQSANARMQDVSLTPSSISSYGTPSTRQAFNNNAVRVLKYTVKDKYKNKINNFINRFGNKFNNYDTIDIKSYKGYIKFIMPDVDGSIDNVYMNKIIEILERGIYIE